MGEFTPPSVDNRAAAYAAVDQSFRAIIKGEPDRTLRYATLNALLVETFGERFFWTGFYLVDPLQPRHLIVGPYQGTMGCLRIPFGKGVCGTAAATGKVQIVANVDKFPGHIACDGRTRSEIVLPFYDAGGRLLGVLDIDSTELAAFDEVDAAGLAQLLRSLVEVD